MGTEIRESGARAAWAAFRDHLDRIRAATGQELLRYPQPTTECDLHYRDLLERRRRVNEELGALKVREPDAQPDSNWLFWFEERVAVSAFADEAVRGDIACLLGREDAH